MKVFIVVSYLGYGGLSKVALCQARNLENSSVFDVRIIELKRIFSHGFFKNVLSFICYLTRRKRILIISHGLPSDVLVVFLHFLGFRTLNWIHGYYPFHFKWDTKGTVKWILFKIFSVFVLHYGNLVFLDDEMKKFYASKGINGMVVQNFYREVFPIARPDGLDRSFLKNFRSSRSYLLLAISGTSYRKGYDRLLKFVDEFPQVGVIVVGAIDKEIVSHPGVLTVGYISNWSNILQEVDGFIHLSRAEGSPLGVIEALQSDKLLILSNILAHKSLIGLEGVISISEFSLFHLRSKYNRSSNLVFSDDKFLNLVQEYCE